MMPLPLNLIEKVRQENPVVLTIANMVTPDKVADGLSAVGASPIMSAEPQEAAEMVALANGITINLGTITNYQEKEIKAVLKSNQNDKPLVLDPVAIGASAYRHSLAMDLLNNYHFTVIRANAGEIASLAGVNWQSHGIDSGSGNGNQEQLAKAVAKKFDCIVILSGKTDIITDGTNSYLNHLTTPNFVKNVGSGDMLSSIIAAYLAVSDHPFLASCVATKVFTAAGVKAAREVTGFGQWQVRLMNELAVISPQEIFSIM